LLKRIPMTPEVSRPIGRMRLVVGAEPDGLCALADQQQVILDETSRAAMTSSSSRRLIAMMPLGPHVLECGQLRLLHSPQLGGQHQVGATW